MTDCQTMALGNNGKITGDGGLGGLLKVASPIINNVLKKNSTDTDYVPASSHADLKASDPNHILHVQWIVGIIMARLISSVMGTPTAISVPAILIAVVFSMVIGIVFGIYPAAKASGLQPVDALRAE